jgi:hypothetical protein
MESDWGKSVNMLIYSTLFGELFTVVHDNETPKTALLRLCLFKQNNITKESSLKTRQQSRRERRKTSRCESVS